MADERILIVEDDGIIVARLADLLQRWGYDCAVAASAEEAIGKAEAFRPALALMDIRLGPGADGIEVAERLRARFDIPSVYLTAHTNESLLERAKHTAPYGYLAKPVRDWELRATLETALHRAALDRALQESEHRYRAVVTQSLEGVLLVQAETLRFVETNEAFQRILGFSAEELLELTLFDVVAHDPEEIQANARQVLKEGSRNIGERRYRHKGGALIPVTVSSMRVDGARGTLICAVVHDLSEEKRTEDGLRLYGEILGQMGEGVNLVRVDDGAIVYTNPAFDRMFGYAPGELDGKHIRIVNAPTDRSPEETANAIMAALRREGAWRGEICNVRKDGTQFWCDVTISTFCHAHYGTVWISIHRDVTERERVEDALRETEERFRDLAESIADVFFALDKDLRYTYWNKASERLTGIGAEEALGKSICEVFPDEAGAMAAKVYQEVLETQQARSFVNEHRLCGVDYAFEITAYPAKAGLSVFVKDVTGRKSANGQP